MKYLGMFFLIGAMALILLTATRCAFPDVSKIDLADCTKSCNETSKVCFAAANDAAADCLMPDASNYERNACVNKQVTSAEQCINNLVSCEALCVEDTQKQLGGK